MSTLNTTNIKHAANAGDANLVLAADGTSTFNNDVTIDGDLSAAAGTFSGDINCTGAFLGTKNIVLNRPGTDSPAGALVQYTYNDAIVYRIGNNGNVTLGDPTSPNIRLDANGFGKFYTPGRTTGSQSVVNFNSDAYGSDTVAVSIRANGDILQKGATKPMSVVFELERDNPANYDAEGEYTGPTLDVKDRVLNLISRLDALEANEVIDDATDTSLLQLIASASARLDSIEARLTALEGGN